ncbi:MAG TPA: cation:proton antiporter [Thermoanaerobaculia bacterium]|nr:cation:proton antiporter [Thermoanaerobaculia bacterium]
MTTAVHEATLIATVAAAFGLAMLFGFLAVKVKMPPLAGYLLAGVVIGPHTRGFVGDAALAGQLAEIGVMMLMFGVGLRFSFEELAAVRRVVLPGALIQIAAAAAAGAAAALLWHWRVATAIVFGLALSVASTVVLLRTLESRRLLTSFDGHLAVAWLVAQDLVMVVVLVILPLAGGGASGNLATATAITVAKFLAFVVLMLVVGKRLFPRLLWIVAKTGSRELFTLCVAAAAVGIAYGSARLFGVSFALGAFFAGMMMRESALSHRAAQESLPLQDVFAALFFVSVGMLFDPAVLLQQPLRVLAVTAIVMIVSPLAAAAMILLFRYPLSTALTVAAGLGQIGEFSFIVAGLGQSLGLLSAEGHGLVLGGAIVTIAANPLLFAAVAPLQRAKLRRSPDPLAALPMSVDAETLTGHVVLVGYGRVGQRIAGALAKQGIACVVIEQNRELVERLREHNVPAVSGDAADPAVLVQGHVARARMLVIATPDTLHVRKMADVARMLNPQIEIVVRTHSDDEAALLRRDNIGTVFMGEHELAAGMTRHVLERMTA